jgi:uncharacterized membrane protein
MLGFLIGTACLFGLIRTVRGHGYGRWRRGYYGPRGALRLLFERLDTSPGQEKVILAAVEELWKSKSEIRGEIEQSRKDIARAMRGSAFDDAALNDAFARHDALHARLRESVRHALSTVHEALDDRQRKLAGDLIEGVAGFGFARGGCGHSRWHHRHHGHHDSMPENGQGPYRSTMWT